MRFGSVRDYGRTSVPARLCPSSRVPGNNLSGVKNIIAVFSCKGGVGKSTVAERSPMPTRNQLEIARVRVLSAGGSCNGSLLAARRVNLAATLNAMGHKVRPILVPPRPISIVNRIAQGTC